MTVTGSELVEGLSEEEKAYVLNGATGDDSARDEDIVRLDTLRSNRQYFRQRNEYGPSFERDGTQAWRVANLLLTLCVVAIAVVIVWGPK